MHHEYCKDAQGAVNAGTGFAGVFGQEMPLHTTGHAGDMQRT